MDTSVLLDLNTKFRTASRISLPHKLRCGAFSLVEVTVSIGIVAFAFVTILGLLPTGLNTFRRAMDASVGAQIAQLVINDVQQTDFAILTSSTSAQSFRYFDDEGIEVVPSNSTSLSLSEKQKVTYWVNTQVSSTTTVPASASANSNLATVKIQVANNPSNSLLAQVSGETSWSGAFARDPSNAGAVPIASYWTLVSRNR